VTQVGARPSRLLRKHGSAGIVVCYEDWFVARVGCRSHGLDGRLAAILAADVAGYTRLMGPDEGTHRRLPIQRDGSCGATTPMDR
jgi:hypothetical protein